MIVNKCVKFQNNSCKSIEDMTKIKVFYNYNADNDINADDIEVMTIFFFEKQMS